MSAAESSLDDFYTSNSPHKRTLEGALEDEFDRISITQGSPPSKMTRLHDDRDQMPIHTCEGMHLFIKNDVSRIISRIYTRAKRVSPWSNNVILLVLTLYR